MHLLTPTGLQGNWSSMSAVIGGYPTGGFGLPLTNWPLRKTAQLQLISEFVSFVFWTILVILETDWFIPAGPAWVGKIDDKLQ